MDITSDIMMELNIYLRADRLFYIVMANLDCVGMGTCCIEIRILFGVNFGNFRMCASSV